VIVKEKAIGDNETGVGPRFRCGGVVNRKSRRAFLEWLAASPLWRGGTASAFAALTDSEAHAADERADTATLIASADQAVNVFDFEAVARQKLSDAHWTYLAMGVDGEATLRANREGFAKFDLKARRLIDVSQVDMATEVLGAQLRSPILLCPVGAQKAFTPEGELDVARAAKAEDRLMVLSTVSTAGVEDVIEARGAPVWYQLYPTGHWPVTQALLKRAERAGCPVVALTVDLPARNTERITRFARDTNPECAGCHVPGFAGSAKRYPMFDGLDLAQVAAPNNAAMTWDYVKRLQDATSMRLVLKGITAPEDALLAVEHGVAGIIVSNHGGRADESGRSTIESLPGVIEAVGGGIPVIIDSGFRRGTDVFKALALGAAAVGIGRPYLWGLAAFGQAGVERVLAILDRELRITMQQAGTPSLRSITRDAVMTR
jgi:isopentenyl diphosphate isomerase/L-lactate dehydrogenase-like FMN-dependent dehydrogenase